MHNYVTNIRFRNDDRNQGELFLNSEIVQLSSSSSFGSSTTLRLKSIYSATEPRFQSDKCVNFTKNPFRIDGYLTLVSTFFYEFYMILLGQT